MNSSTPSAVSSIEARGGMHVMGPNHVIMKYHNSRMLLTVDLNALLGVLFDVYGDSMSVEFAAMSEEERAKTIDKLGEVRAVRDRFQVFEIQDKNIEHRRLDIERAAVLAGFK